jgi:hypothetical protein
VYVLLCAKISVNYNGFCVSTSVFATLNLSIVRKEDLTGISVFICRCLLPYTTDPSNPVRFFFRGVEFEACC